MNNVEINKFLSKYLVPRGGEKSPHEIRERFDSIVRNHLDKECDRLLSSTWQDEPGVCFVRNLQVKLTLNASRRDDPAIAGIWANSIITELRRVVHHPVDRNNVMVFPDKTEYLARFLVDLLRGTAWQQWYYQELEPLRKLSIRETIREVFKDNHLIIEDILLILMKKASLSRLLEELRPDDTKIIFESYLDAVPRYNNRSYRELVPRLMKLFDESTLGLMAGRFLSHENYLALYLTAIQRYPNLRPVASLRKAVKLVSLVRYFLMKFNNQETLERTVALQDIKGLRNMICAKTDVHPADLDTLLGEITGSEEKEALFEIIKGAGKEAKAAENRLITAYGGLFTFSRIIIESDLHRFINASSFPTRHNFPGIKAFLFFLGQKLVGYRRPLCEVTDRGLLIFAGYQCPPSRGLFEEFLQSVTPQMNRRFLQSLAASLPNSMEAVNRKYHGKQVSFNGMLDITSAVLYRLFAARLRRFEASSPAYLLRNFISRPSEITLGQESIHIKLSKRPLDAILRMSGLLEDIDGIPWLDHRRLEFTLER